MINLGNIEIADLRLGASQAKALCLGSMQVWGGEQPVVHYYDVQSVGRSTSDQGLSVEITEDLSGTITLYFKTNANDMSGKSICMASYTSSSEVAPYFTVVVAAPNVVNGFIEMSDIQLSAVMPSS